MIEVLIKNNREPPSIMDTGIKISGIFEIVCPFKHATVWIRHSELDNWEFFHEFNRHILN